MEQLRGQTRCFVHYDDAGYSNPEVWKLTEQELHCAMQENGGFRDLMHMCEQHHVVLDLQSATLLNQPQPIKLVPYIGQIAVVSNDHRQITEIIREIHTAFHRSDPRLLLDVPIENDDRDRDALKKWLEETAYIPDIEPLTRCTPETFSYLSEDEIPSTRAQRRHGHRARNTGKGPRKEWWNS